MSNAEQLLAEYFSDLGIVKYEKYSKKDELFSDVDRLEKLFENFYLRINPKFEIMDTLDPQPKIPEYKNLVANMLKDLHILKTTELYPDKTTRLSKTTELEELLKLLNDVITDGYLYIDVIRSVTYFMELFDLASTEELKLDCESLREYYIKTPYIFFPSFYMLDFYKINILIGVPVINFLISNHNIEVHSGQDHNVCKLINHDINFHNTMMKIEPLGILAVSRFVKLFQMSFSLDKDILKRFEVYFVNMNNIILKLIPLLKYEKISLDEFKDHFKNGTIPNTQNYRNYMNSFFLYYIFFESVLFNDFRYNESSDDPYQVFDYLLSVDIYIKTQTRNNFITFLKAFFEPDSIELSAGGICYKYYKYYIQSIFNILKIEILEVLKKKSFESPKSKDIKYLKYKHFPEGKNVSSLDKDVKHLYLKYSYQQAENSSLDIWQAKYLKYKQKYIQLKNLL